MRCSFNVRSKADIRGGSQLNLPHGTKTKKWKTEKLKSKKTDMLRSIGKESGESVESVRCSIYFVSNTELIENSVIRPHRCMRQF